MAECPTCGSTVTTWDEGAERDAEMALMNQLLTLLPSDWRRSADNGLEKKVEGVGYIVLLARAQFKVDP